MPSRKKASKNDIEISKASFLPPQEQEYVRFSLMGLPFFFFFFGVVNNISIFVLNEFYDFLLGLIYIVATKGNVSLVYSNLCIGETSIRYRLFFIGSVWFDLLMELYSHAVAAKYTFMILLHFKSCRLGLTLNAVLTS